MGVIYKLEPKVIDFILAQKKENPALSCRKLVESIKGSFQLEVSKSSVNKVLKNSGLSMPVGRRKTKRKYTLKEQIAGTISGTKSLPKETMLPAQEEKPLLEEKPPQPPKEEIPQPIEKPVPEPIPEPPAEKLVGEIIKEPVPEPTQELPPMPAEELRKKLEKLIPVAEAAQKPAAIEEKPADKERPKEEPAQPPEIEISPAPPEEELPAELECTSVMLLKAADALIGGGRSIAQLIQNNFGKRIDDVAALAEGLIYLPLLKKDGDEKSLRKNWALLGRKVSLSRIDELLKALQKRPGIAEDIRKALPGILKEVRCIKVALSNGNNVYLDGQMHSVWSNPYIPYDFSSTLPEVKSSIAQCFNDGRLFALFMAAGYETPTEEFFNLLLSLDFLDKKITKIAPCDQKLEEIESLKPQKEIARNYLFGMWPWQFTSCRKVRDVGQFKAYKHPVTSEELFLADIELELSQPAINKTITFRGCSVKRNPADRVKLVILGNLPPDRPAEEIAQVYLSRWPNIEEGLQDYSKKVELFTYSANSQHIPLADKLPTAEGIAGDAGRLINEYLKILDLYVRRYFFPAGFENKGFDEMLKNFYCLDCRLKINPDTLIAAFSPEETCPYANELAYACRRINERELFINGRRLRCEVNAG